MRPHCSCIDITRKACNCIKRLLIKNIFLERLSAIAQYCVQVYSKFKRDNSDKIAETTNGVKVWSGAYSEEFGLNNEEEILYI